MSTVGRLRLVPIFTDKVAPRETSCTCRRREIRPMRAGTQRRQRSPVKCQKIQCPSSWLNKPSRTIQTIQHEAHPRQHDCSYAALYCSLTHNRQAWNHPVMDESPTCGCASEDHQNSQASVQISRKARSAKIAPPPPPSPPRSPASCGIENL